MRKGDHKLIVSLVDPPQPFNLAADPLELSNLAGLEDVRAIESELSAEVNRRWQLDELNAAVLGSQKRRRWIQQQLSSADRDEWNFQPFTDAAKQYVRGGKPSSPTLVKGLARYPYVSPKLPDTPRKPG